MKIIQEREKDSFVRRNDSRRRICEKEMIRLRGTIQERKEENNNKIERIDLMKEKKKKERTITRSNGSI